MANCLHGACVGPTLVGAQLTATCTLTQNGVLYDPVAVFAWACRGPFVYSTATPLTVVRMSTGVYYATYTPPSAGLWTFVFADSATAPAGSTIVQTSHQDVIGIY